jgi:protein subunit release factor B
MRKRTPPLEHELEITHTKGSGPGGQNRNKRMSGVRVKHLPTGIVTNATERRSQAQNLAAALERIDEKVEKHFHKPAPRHSTKPTKGSKKRRVEGKKVRSKVKGMRRRPSDSDW